MLDTVFTAAATVSVACAVKLPAVAVMVAVPAAIAFVRPELLTVVTAVFDELQLTPVGVAVEPSLYFALAVNCCVAPAVAEADVGEIESAVMVTDAARTVRPVDPLTPFSEAETVADPAATPVASPLAFTVVIAALDELHAADEVTFAVLPSLYVPVAVNCAVPLTCMFALAGVTVIDVRLLGVFVWLVVEELPIWPPPQPATHVASREQARDIRAHR